jgi:hypothetical protein
MTDRWVLAPGLRVVRRGRDRVQLGLEEPVRVVLPRSPVVRALLDAVATGSPVPDHPGIEPLLARLVERGCLVPALGVRPARVRIGLRLLGADPPAQVAARLRETGLDLAAWEQDAVAVLVLSVGETPREVLDPLVRDAVPHLVLRFTDGGATLGPLVQPGATACLRCLDAQLATDDPERAPVLLRYVEATARPRPDGVPDLSDAGLLPLTLGWAARDLRAFSRGDTPSTWSRTLRWEPAAPEPVATAWLRHPGCGCSWGALGGATRMRVPVSGTMGA